MTPRERVTDDKPLSKRQRAPLTAAVRVSADEHYELVERAARRGITVDALIRSYLFDVNDPERSAIA